MDGNDDQRFMRAALELASAAEQMGEVPVGAVVIRNGEIIGRGQNRNLLDHDPTAHAEVVALRDAARKLGNHRLSDCSLFVTIEPCAMCAGAIIHARLQRLVYGASDPKAGAAGSVLTVINHPSLNHQLEVLGGVLETECSQILQSFFRRKRAGL
jgi:tRNA(adenine34) deaminase